MSDLTRFSEAAFAACQGDQKRQRELADALQTEVQMELQEVMLAKWLEIIARLNALGHELRQYDVSDPGLVVYRDDDTTGSGYDCKLRLACDIIISAGYRDVRSSLSNPSPSEPAI
jgi:hypothetical protein